MIRTETRWLSPQTDEQAVAHIIGSVRISHLTARLLVRRGLTTPEEVDRFLRPSLLHLHNPETLPDIGRAVAAIREAVADKQRITVYGDYDVDGLTATTLLLEFLRLLGADARHYIPHRVSEGYSLRGDAVRAIAQDGTRLLITVDCGVSSHEEIALANSLGMKVVVTDHHEAPPLLPPAVAVVNPHRRDSAYPFKSLAGVGVAFKVCWALAESYSSGRKVTPEFRAFLLDSLALVALGTVADIVPLVDENRVLVRAGLPVVASSVRPGVQALRAVARIADVVPTTSDVAFKLAPRLNAAGRIEHGELALELLLTHDPAVAAHIAGQLDRANTQRRNIEKVIVEAVDQRIAAQADLSQRATVVLADPLWHLGVVGIVAGKVARTRCRPAIICNITDGYCKGSARSIDALNILEAISECSQHLDSFGGHAKAAGLGMREENFAPFCEAFEAAVRRRLADEDFAPRLAIDTEVQLPEMDALFMQDMECLEPFGEANSRPVLAVRGCRLAGRPRLMGADARHINFQVTDGRAAFRVVGFNRGDIYDDVTNWAAGMDLAFSPMISDFGGRRCIELHLEDIRPHE